MYKKLLFSVVVISLGVATNIAQGAWCMDGRICTPAEEVDLCDPMVWGGEVPGGDTDIVLPCEWECMKICCDIDIDGRFNGPGGDCDQTLRIYCGTINVGDQWWVANSGSGIGTLILEGTTVVNSTSGSSRSFRCGDTGGNPRVLVRENATLNINGGWRNGDASGGWICLHFSGDCYVHAREYIRIGDDGAGEMHFDGGTVVCDGSIFQNGRGGTDMGPSSMTAGEVYADGDFGVLSQRVKATFDMSGGAINCNNFNVHGGGGDGEGTLSMTGGLIIARNRFNCPSSGGGAVAHAQLDGGEVRCDDLRLPEGGTIDITGGKIVLSGNQIAEVQELACVHARLTGYGSPLGVVYTYDADQDKTIVTATPDYDPMAPYCPTPPDASLAKCGSGVCIYWLGTRGIRDRHAVYFSDDRECVENMDPACMLGYVPASRPAQWCVPPEELTLWTTYYWRIVEVYYGGPSVSGPVWSLTCGCPPLIGDFNRDCVVNFEDYAQVATTWQQEEMWP
ncbi:MAG: hypothetical protein ACYS4W_04745 [Planctomycetota bacterium]|jgi:hypothetical protein